MRRILLDQNAPVGLRPMLPECDVRTARQMGWDTLANGELLSAAEQEWFDVVVTADKNMGHQQNLANQHIALVVLGIGLREPVKQEADRVVTAIRAAAPGTYNFVAITRPELRRRPFARDCDV